MLRLIQVRCHPYDLADYLACFGGVENLSFHCRTGNVEKSENSSIYFDNFILSEKDYNDMIYHFRAYTETHQNDYVILIFDFCGKTEKIYIDGSSDVPRYESLVED